MALVLLDTNVCLRLTNTLSPEQPIVETAVQVLLDAGHTLCTTPQVLIELWVVATRPLDVNGFGWTPERANSEVNGMLSALRLLPDDPLIFDTWRALITTHQIKGKRAHDARIAAVLKVNRIPYILTFNISDFSSFPGIIALDPVAVANRLVIE